MKDINMNKNELKTIIRNIIEESKRYSEDLGKNTFIEPANRPVFGEKQIGHIYQRNYKDNIGRSLVTLDEQLKKVILESSDGKIPSGILCGIEIPVSIDPNQFGSVIINIDTETISFLQSYGWDDEKYGLGYWTKPMKYKRLIIQKPEYFDF